MYRHLHHHEHHHHDQEVTMNPLRRKKKATPTTPAKPRWEDVTPIETVSPSAPQLMRMGRIPIHLGMRSRAARATQGSPWKIIHEGATRWQRREMLRDGAGRVHRATRPATNEVYRKDVTA